MGGCGEAPTGKPVVAKTMPTITSLERKCPETQDSTTLETKNANAPAMVPISAENNILAGTETPAAKT